MREQISDTATAMFLDRGFDEVRVSEVADACGVSEKTIFNYFPTKESLLFDREEDMAAEIRRSLGPDAAPMSPVDAVVMVLEKELAKFLSYWDTTELKDVSGFRRFSDLIARTPALRAAQNDMTERLGQVAAGAMAARVGVNPDDPEPQIAADALMGLWRIYFRAVTKYSYRSVSASEVKTLVLADVRRAARLIDTGLWSFGMAVQGANGRQQLKIAAEASNEARKQVMLAIKQAREAWRLIKAESSKQGWDQHDYHPNPGLTKQEMKQEIKAEIKQQAQQMRRDAHKQAARMRAQQSRRVK
jgi:AcrR family transcriptional regulator